MNEHSITSAACLKGIPYARQRQTDFKYFAHWMPTSFITRDGKRAHFLFTAGNHYLIVIDDIEVFDYDVI